MIFIFAPKVIKDYAYALADALGLDNYGETDLFIELEDFNGEMAGAAYGDMDSACIELDSSDTLVDQMKTLAHEMVHVAQFFRGDLIIDGSQFIWKGLNVTDVPYMEQPHELEAYSQEVYLYNICK